MIITFCGHSDFNMSTKYEPILMSLLEKLLQENPIEFYLGGYGQFDNFAFSCVKKFKQAHPTASLTFVSPYLEFSRAIKASAFCTRFLHALIA